MRKPRLGEAGFQASLKGESSSQKPRNHTVKLHSTVWKLGVKLGAALEGRDETKMGRGHHDPARFQGKPWLDRLPSTSLPQAVARDSNSSRRGSGRGRGGAAAGSSEAAP